MRTILIGSLRKQGSYHTNNMSYRRELHSAQAIHDVSEHEYRSLNTFVTVSTFTLIMIAFYFSHPLIMRWIE